jgi:hypothetical protein
MNWNIISPICYIYHMKKPLLFAIFFIASLTVSAQKLTVDTSQVFTSVDKIPEFPGGVDKFKEYIDKNVKNTLRKINKSGLVVVISTIEKDGSFTNVRSIKSLNAESDSIAVNIVSKTPKLSPAIKDGKPVRCKYSIPVWFGDPSLQLRVKDPGN